MNIKIDESIKENEEDELFDENQVSQNSNEDDSQDLPTNLGSNAKIKKSKKNKKKKSNANIINTAEPEENKEIHLMQREYTKKEIDRRWRYFNKLDLPIWLDIDRIKQSLSSEPKEQSSLKNTDIPKPLIMVSPDYFYKK